MIRGSEPLLPRGRMLLAALPFVVLLALTWTGIDFGRHWDEDFNKLSAVQFSLRSGFTLLPDSYVYPGVNYWLTFDALLPEMIREVAHSNVDPARFAANLIPVLDEIAFRLRVRRIYAFVTSLTGVWIFLTVLVWKRTWIEAACASLLFAVSWEIVYHGRWIAPDTILMQFGSLAFLLTSLAWKRGSRLALYGAAIAAGLACGSKYPGALIVLPVLATVWLAKRSWRGGALDSAAVLALMTAAYLLTTPGTVIQPLIFLRSVLGEIDIYRSGWFGYSVVPGTEHLFKVFVYFATQLFSTFTPISVVLFGFACLGTGALLREPWRDALIFLLFPVCYLLYFSTQRAMIVRNYLVATPFLFMLCARGLTWFAELLPWHKLRVCLAAAVAAVIAVNAVDQVMAAETIVRRGNTGAFLDDFERYAEKHSNRTLAISPRLEHDLRERGFWTANLIATRVAGLSGSFDEYVTYYKETISPHELEWPTNRRHSFVAVFGPREVNLDYYTGWWGDDRVVSLSAALVHEMDFLHLDGR